MAERFIEVPSIFPLATTKKRYNSSSVQPREVVS